VKARQKKDYKKEARTEEDSKKGSRTVALIWPQADTMRLIAAPMVGEVDISCSAFPVPILEPAHRVESVPGLGL
jgi:hypothetical protein